MRGIIAYFKKSFLTAMQYKFELFMAYVIPLITLGLFYILLQNPFKNAGYTIVTVDNYGISYLKYAISGIVLSFYPFKILISFCQEMQDIKRVGQLEMLLVSPTGFGKIIGAMFIWRLFFNLIIISPFLIFGVYYIRAHYVFTINQILSMSLVLSLSLVSFFCFALCVTGLILIFDKVVYFVGLCIQVLRVLGDILVPIYLLPEPLKLIAAGLPLRLYLNPLRGIIFNNYSLINIIPYLCKLFIFIIIMGPISVIFFRFCLKKAMTDGILGRY
jgi:hypothetical protein